MAFPTPVGMASQVSAPVLLCLNLIHWFFQSISVRLRDTMSDPLMPMSVPRSMIAQSLISIGDDAFFIYPLIVSTSSGSSVRTIVSTGDAADPSARCRLPLVMIPSL